MIIIKVKRGLTEFSSYGRVKKGLTKPQRYGILYRKEVL